MTGRWPWPDDTPMAVRAAVVGFYRQRLADVDPQGCADIDDRMITWGQTWAAPRVVPDPDEWISAKHAADLAGVAVARIAIWRRTGRLTGRPVGKRWQYRPADVLAAKTGGRSHGMG